MRANLGGALDKKNWCNIASTWLLPLCVITRWSHIHILSHMLLSFNIGRGCQYSDC